MADNNKMLIDATHPEETRVVVLRGGRVEEFDYESAARKLLRGNIYLAKVTRVEPALQAAFVDYGGNRHGFLAFSEIHPDYYQIPVADRLALIEEEAAIEAEEEAEADARAERLEKRRSKSRRGGRGRQDQEDASDDSPDSDGDGVSDSDDEDYSGLGRSGSDDDDDRDDTDGGDYDSGVEEIAARADDEGSDDGADADEAGRSGQADSDESGGGDDGRSGPKSIAQAMARDDVLKGEPQGSAEDGSSEPEQGQPQARQAGQRVEVEASVDQAVDEADAAHRSSDEPQGQASDAGGTDAATQSAATARAPSEDDDGDASDENDDDNGDADVPEEVASEADAMEELPARPRRSRRSYKIQEVIKRRQVLLIQVVKEERGNKGAALTTYLSLAGRYTVLMPNTARGGGISRKITQPQDRKRLKAIANELEVPEGMGLIIRTAGAARTKQEIRRDFEYLLRLWESVREMTLQSTAPSLVYEEGDLIKRSIRDLYNKEIDEVIVAGDEAHRSAKDFMNMLMPSHAKNVTRYTDPEPLFTRYQIERQLNAMFSPTVTLKSGGYLVINQTEALVAIDVNSGRSTREFSIEETALHTNLEASDEIARQLKLRDLAGLIVIDFIDMEEKRNNRKVEHRLKDALRFDRARIQVGRISHFGLMEMSRQRMRTGVLEGSTSQCAHCQGTGIIRSTESVALAVLRGLEDAVMARSRGPLIATTTATVALYILNNKREFIIEMEKRHGWSVSVQASDKLAGANFTIEKGPPSAETKTQRRPERSAAVSMDWGFEDQDGDEEEASADKAPVERGPETAEARGETDDTRKRRRRRRRGGRRGERSSGDGETRSSDSDDEDGDDIADLSANGSEDGEGTDDDANAKSQNGSEANGDDDENQRSRRGRRRGRRGGRRNRERNAQGRSSDDTSEQGDAGAADDDSDADDYAADGSEHVAGLEQQPGNGGEDAPQRHDASSSDPSRDDTDTDTDTASSPRPRRRTRRPESADASTDSPDDRGEEPSNGPAAAATADTGSNGPAGHAGAASRSAAPDAQAPDANGAETDAPPGRVENAEPGEPKLHRVKVGPDVPAGNESAATSADSDGSDGESKPTRRGWWQRRLMGE